MATDTVGRKRQFSKRKRSRDIKPIVKSAIRDKALVRGWTAAEIFRFLEQGAKDKKWDETDVPSIRTIQRVVQELKTEQEMSPWILKDAVEEDAGHVLDVLQVVIWLSEGRKQVLTKEEAEWVIRLRRARPGLPPLLVWVLSRLYMSYEAQGTDTLPLDAYLAYQPWRSDEEDFGSFRAYSTAVVHKWIPSAPFEALRYILPSDTAWVLTKDLDSTLRRLVDGTMKEGELNELLREVKIILPEDDLSEEMPEDWDVDSDY